jgi:hypothetical protein
MMMNTIRNLALAASTVLALGALATGSALASQGVYDNHGHLVGFAPSSTEQSIQANAGSAVATTGVYDVHGSLVGFAPAEQGVRADAGAAFDAAVAPVATVGVYDVHGSLTGFVPAK